MHVMIYTKLFYLLGHLGHSLAKTSRIWFNPKGPQSFKLRLTC